MMIWYKDYDIPGTNSFTVKKELLNVFKDFCREEFFFNKKDIYDDFDLKIERNIFLSDFSQADKEYIKLIFGQMKMRDKSFIIEDVIEILESELLSNPTALVINHNNINFFVLKQACKYVSLVHPSAGRFKWLEVLDDIKIITSNDFFVSEAFKLCVDASRNKVIFLLKIFKNIEEKTEECTYDISMNSLLKTSIVIKLPEEKRELIEEMLFQRVLHPSMNLPESITNPPINLLQYLIERSAPNTNWFIKQSIYHGEDWLNYKEMFDYFLEFYNKLYSSDKLVSVLLNKNKASFEENLNLIKTKLVLSELNLIFTKENNPANQEDEQDYGLDKI